MNSLGRMVLRVLLLCLFCGFSDAAVPQLPFKDFLKQFQVKSPTVLQAQRSYARVEQTRDSRNDLWQSRFVVRPEMNFSARKFDSGIIEDISNRSQNVSGTYTQNFPTGTSLELSGQKFLEVANPLFSSTDRQYSATISQDLFRNAFGEVQKSQAKKAQKDLEVAELEFRQSIVGACEEAFNLYVDTFIQQEVSQLLDSQLRDAKQALRISMRLYKDRLITKIDKLSSESDYINTKNEAERAKQRLVNGKRQILAYLDRGSLEMALVDPSGKLETPVTKKQAETLSEIIADTRVVSQELDVKRSRSDRRTDVQLNLQAGERFGRSRFDLSLVEFKEEFLLASVNIGFDIINRTEDSDLTTAIALKNSLEKQKYITRLNQKSLLENLYANHNLLKEQMASAEYQVRLLKQKMEIAFNQMKRAKLNFENYLLHRNAFLDRKVNFLNLKKDFWLNQFAIQKEFAHKEMRMCEVMS